MIVTVNPEVGGVSTDQKSRFFNVLRCLHAVCTAAANSTPVVNPVNTSNGTLNGGYNCITIISNTEAGGWSNAVSTTTFANTTYNASAGAQWVDLYQTGTGKTTFPYLRASFGNQSYTFASSFTSYPRLQWSLGCSANNPTSIAVTSTDIWNQTPFCGVREPTGLTSYQYGAIRFDEAGMTYTIASTQNYIIIVSPSAMVYFGLRTVSGWELTKTDNVPWVYFAYGRGQNDTVNWCTNSQTHQDVTAMYGTGIKQDGTFPIANATGWGGGQYQGYNYPCTLTYQTGGGNYYGFPSVPSYSYLQNSYGTSYNYLRPIIPNYLLSNQNAESYNYFTNREPPMSDPITGLSVPAAYPVVFSGYNTGNMSGVQGTAYGIMRGPHMTKAGLDYYVTASEYTINGESWIPVRTGAAPNYPDMWFIRKA